MKHIYLKLCILSLCVASLTRTSAQITEGMKFVASEPVQVSDFGTNKVVNLSDGKTVLVHLEPKKHISFDVFNSEHKHVMTTAPMCNIVDESLLDKDIVKAIFELDGKVAIFIQQVIMNRQCLVRLMFDATAGKIVAEDVISESKSFKDPINHFIVKTGSDGYAICYYRNLSSYEVDQNMKIAYYNAQHKQTRAGYLRFPYDRVISMRYLGFDVLPNVGAVLSLEFTTNPKATAVEKYALIALLADSEAAFRMKRIPLAEEIGANYVLFSKDRNTKCFNALLTTSEVGATDELHPKAVIGHASYYLRFRTEDLYPVTIQPFNNEMANDWYQTHTDTLHRYTGIPFRILSSTTNASPLIVSEASFIDNDEKGLLETKFGNIGLTRLDTAGNQVNGIIIPKLQYMPGFIAAASMARKDINNYVFSSTAGPSTRGFRDLNRLADASISRTSFECISKQGKDYIFFNEYPSNVEKLLDEKREEVADYFMTEPIVYEVDELNIMNRYYLFGKPSDGKTRSLELTSADYDGSRGIYSCVSTTWDGKAAVPAVSWFQIK